MVAGSGLVAVGICYCRKVVAGSGLIAAGAELVAAGARRWSLLQEGGRRCRTGSCFCREVVADAGVVVAATGKWSPVQEGSCWWRLKEY